MTDAMTHPILVIGAGIGGLSAAIRLASAGKRVTIFEQNPMVGGKMSQFEADGFRWDSGPSVITMRHVFEDLFQAAGRSMADYLTLLPVDPLTRYFYGDGSSLDVCRDAGKMAAQLAQFGERDVRGYADFLDYAAQLHRITGPVFIYDQPPSFGSMAKLPLLDIFKIDPWLTMEQAINKRVRSPKLRQLLGRFATYVGASPYLAPATLSVIADVEINGGVWYPQGGIYQIASALQRLALELGVEIHTNSAVEAITVEQGRASGVVLQDGRRFAAAAVVSNLDVTTTYHRLLPDLPAIVRQRQTLARLETSCSGYALLLGVEGEHPQLAHHNIFFCDDYRREFEDIFQHGIPPQEPTVYVAITSKSDPSHAPAGCENWFVLVNAPALGKSFGWEENERQYRQIVFNTLERFGIHLQKQIRSTIQLTPVEIARMSGAWRGALYGISSNSAMNAFRRPHNRCPDLKNLYFAGGTTHPGGGVPMVMLSGKVAAELVLKDS